MNKRIFSIIVLILILSLILTLSSKKELKNVEEIKVKEESNNIIGIYIKQEDNTYKQSNTIPDGYSIISSESYCIVGDNKDVKTYDMFSYDTSSKTLSVSNLTSKDTKCYLYFEKVTTKKVTTTIGEITVNLGAPTFTGAACAEGTNNSSHTSSNCEITDQNGIYEATTSEGTTYYYRGTVDNNWVKFGNYWWRIIRINENGTIRMIYSGTNNAGDQPADATDNDPKDPKKIGRWVPKNNSQTGTSTYNTDYQDNAYVGFKYGTVGTSGSSSYTEAHTNTNDSAILTALKAWYNEDKSMNKSLIDGGTGFCNDRELATSNHGQTSYNNYGYAKNATFYAAYDRTHATNSTSWAEHTPTFECKNKARDLITQSIAGIPVGLITADEVIYAGGYGGQSNYGYWLYTGKYYWTMSPLNFNGRYAYVFRVLDGGDLNIADVHNTTPGVRPVINLKATTNFTGSGTIGDPYIPS